MEEKQKKSFVMYSDWYLLCDRLSVEQKGHLFTAILEYNNDILDKQNNLDPASEMLFNMMKMQFDRDSVKWKDTCSRRSESGKKGGIASGISRQSERKEQLNDIESAVASTSIEKKNIYH